MSKHYPDGYRPQTYGEEKLADSMSKEQIQKAIDDKEKMRKEDPEGYINTYCGMGF